MNIILGASGKVGSTLVKILSENGQPVKAIVRNPKKADEFRSRKIPVCIADFLDIETLKMAFEGGTTVFLITPENPDSQNIFDEIRQIIQNYRDALSVSGISKIIGLSSGGAQHPAGTGNLELSYILEHSFKDLPAQKTFIRPAYYFSNWLNYWDVAKKYGVLPTFFPIDMKVQMIAPVDVAAFAAQLIESDESYKPFYEIGEKLYSSADVATVFAHKLQREIKAQQIPSEQWETTLLQAGFSENAAANLMKMTQAVIDGRTQWENPSEAITMPTSLETFFASAQ